MELDSGLSVCRVFRSARRHSFFSLWRPGLCFARRLRDQAGKAGPFVDFQLSINPIPWTDRSISSLIHQITRPQAGRQGSKAGAGSSVSSGRCQWWCAGVGVLGQRPSTSNETRGPHLAVSTRVCLATTMFGQANKPAGFGTPAPATGFGYVAACIYVCQRVVTGNGGDRTREMALR